MVRTKVMDRDKENILTATKTWSRDRDREFDQKLTDGKNQINAQRGGDSENIQTETKIRTVKRDRELPVQAKAYRWLNQRNGQRTTETERICKQRQR